MTLYKVKFIFNKIIMAEKINMNYTDSRKTQENKDLLKKIDDSLAND